MGKRGQFYLIAAFIIILIISGLSYVYTKANVQTENINLAGIAKEIDFELNTAINNAVLKDEGETATVNRAIEIGNYYLDRYPYIDLIIVYGDRSENNRDSHVVSTGEDVDVCHVEADKSTQDKSVERSAVKGHLGHGDKLGKCASQNSYCPPEVIRCTDQYIIDREMVDDEVNNKDIIEVFSIAGDKVELEMKNGERNLYIVVSSVRGEEKSFVVE
ncbi:MAG: hypothetical protein Q7S27_06335 [Nanoarchaeota archaeon]|nr:hypothetical protein [Nanoarchaeota archaeon]